MVLINGTQIDIVHVRHDGRSHDIHMSDLSLDSDVSQQELFSVIENSLDLSLGTLSGYELDLVEASHTAVIRPQAKFGMELSLNGEEHDIKS